MGKAKRELAIQLGFNQTTCKCGVKRTRGADCPDCHRQPERHEVELLSLGRRTSFADLIALHQCGEPSAEWGFEGSESVSEPLQALCLRIAPAFKKAVTYRQPEPLRKVIEELASARAAVEGWPGARPHVEKKRIAIESVGHLGDVVSEYFSACIESTTGDAQARMAKGILATLP